MVGRNRMQSLIHNDDGSCPHCCPFAGVFFFWEGEKNLDIEIRGRAMYVARELAALSADDIITENRFGLYKKLIPPFAANEEVLSGGALLYQMIYDHNCDLLIGSTATEISPIMHFRP